MSMGEPLVRPTPSSFGVEGTSAAEAGEAPTQLRPAELPLPAQASLPLSASTVPTSMSPPPSWPDSQAPAVSLTPAVTQSLPVATQVLMVMGGVPPQSLSKWLWCWCPIILVCNLAMALFDGYSSAVEGELMMLVSLVYCASHSLRLLSLVTLQYMSLQAFNAAWSRSDINPNHEADELLEVHQSSDIDSTRQGLAREIAGTLLEAEHSSPIRFDFILLPPSPRTSAKLLAVATTLLFSTMGASISDFNAGNYIATVTPIDSLLITICYAVAHVSFVACLVLILAAVKGAREHVREAASDVFSARDVNWAAVRPRYVALVKKLRSHCSFVRTPSVLAFATLCVSSLASGIDIWYLNHGLNQAHHCDGKGCETANNVVLLTQCLNFACWSYLTLMLLRQFITVNTDIKKGFLDKINERLIDATDMGDAFQNNLQMSLDLIERMQPGGWFLTSSFPIGQSIFNFSLFLVLLNGAAKLYGIAKEYWA